ncbi:unnamed protein product [Medioppia subpectinata]|uniref:C2H2-type domain-containing protein n=1 Tax=Medioppia subpectinata TaxID=1979941 RepID=A0A7R9PXP4_9ACAR|nr:unnamed protein product [Medioppia subpectinata]CAG2105222.1 unnamed protein product [Medioppia subpectinata]
MENINTIQINAKSAMSETIVIHDLLDEHKLPHLISGVDTKTHRRPLLARNMNDITTGHTFTAGNHMMATDAIKTTSDIIEPNVVSIDLNPTESVKQNSYPIIIADNGPEVLPLIGDDWTQAADKQLKAKQEIIDILDDSDSEDTAATPVTPTVPTATVHHYASVNQTANIWLQTHNGMFYRKTVDQLHASGDQQQHIQTYHRLSTALATTTTTSKLATNPRNPPLTITGENTVPATNPKVYQCLECHKSFLTRKGLQTHNGLRHTKSRNDRFNRYRCSRCRRRFVSLDKLHDHTINGHKQWPYRCPHDRCGRSYVTTSRLRHHTDVCHRKPSASTIDSNLLDTDFGPNNTANSGRHISHDEMIDAKTRSPEECLSPSDMCGQQLATDHDEDSDNSIEPNLVIDLNPTESVNQNTYPIVSANKTQPMAEPRGVSGEELETVSQDQPIRPKTPPMLSLFRRVLNNQTGELESVTTADAEIIVAEPDIAFILMNSAQSVDPIISAIRRQTATGVVQVIDIKKSATDTATLDGIQCPDCGKHFTNKHVMRSHYKYEHSPVDRQRVYACHWPGCDHKTKHKGHLKKHQSVHSSDRPYPCDWPGCDYRGKLKINLKQHQLGHSSDRPYSCEWPGCDYRAKRNTLLQKHKHKHSIDKAYACDWPECGKTFKYPEGLRLHQVIHTGVEIPCDRKGCAFKTKHISALKSHKRLTHV